MREPSSEIDLFETAKRIRILEEYSGLNKTERKRFKRTNPADYERCIVPHLKQTKEAKREKRKDWWRRNWIALVALLVAIIALLKK